MKTTLKRENDKFLAMNLKPISGRTGLVNRPKTPKLWAIAQENGPKREKDKFSTMTLKPVYGPTCLLNRPRTPKLWAVAHENDNKT